MKPSCLFRQMGDEQRTDLVALADDLRQQLDGLTMAEAQFVLTSIGASLNGNNRSAGPSAPLKSGRIH